MSSGRIISGWRNAGRRGSKAAGPSAPSGPSGSGGRKGSAHALAGAVAAALLVGAGALPAAAQGTVRSVHGDWEMRCEVPAGAQAEQCALTQFVQAADRDNIGLNVFVFRTADGQARLLRVFAPLGVFLPSGLGLRIDNASIGTAGFVRCLPEGCMAEAIIDDELLGKLKGGSTATFIVFETPEEGIGIPISLSGFTAGFDALPQ